VLRSVWPCCVLSPGAEPASLAGVAVARGAARDARPGCPGRAPSAFGGSHAFPPRISARRRPPPCLTEGLAAVGALLSGDSAAQRGAAVAGCRHAEAPSALPGLRQGLPSTGGGERGVLYACLRTLLAMLMKILKMLSQLVGPAAPPEDQELLSFLKFHGYDLKRALGCLSFQCHA